MVTLKIVLDTRRASKEGFPIKFKLYEGGKSKYVSLGFYSNKDDWDGSNVKRSHPSFNLVHLAIARETAKATELIFECNRFGYDLDQAHQYISSGGSQEVEIAVMKSKLEEYQSSGTITLIEMMDRIIEEKEVRGEDVVTPSAHKRLFKVYGDVRLNDLDYEWINEFINHHLKSGVSRNSINAYLSTVKAAYRRAQMIDSLRVKQDNPFSKFNMSLRTRAKRREITIESFRAILDDSFTTDLLKFQVMIGGHDLADVACMDESSFSKGRVVFQRFKNRNKLEGGPEVSNLLLPEAMELWRKHDGFRKVPNPWEEHKRYMMFRINHWRNINGRCEEAGVARVGTKGPRYLFRTTAGNLGIDSLTIMTIQGHAPQGMTFSYQMGMDNEVLDQALRRVVDKVFYG